MLIAQKKEDFAVEIRKSEESRMSEGTCYDVIEFLRANQVTDSIAVEIFKEEYEIDNMPYNQQEWLFKKNHIEIIRYFAQVENKKFYCKLNTIINFDPILLME